MTEFDKLLKAAFDAGYDRNEDLFAINEGHYVPRVAPPFEEWRATLSGLNTREDLA